MPFCRICGCTLDDGARFCRLCGTIVALEDQQAFAPSQRYAQPQSNGMFAQNPITVRQRNLDFDFQGRWKNEELFAYSRSNERVVQYVLLPALLLAFLAVKVWLSLQYRMSIWDGYVYLANARMFLLGRSLSSDYFFELLRPPFFPYTIALAWKVTGVSYSVAALIQPIFTVASAYVFFLLLKEMFGLKPAFIGSLFLSVAPEVFFWTNQILVHGEVMFFMVTALYFLWRGIHGGDRYALPLAGGALALATLTRYTILLLVPVFLVILFVLFIALYRRGAKYPWVGVGSMVLVFILLWAPWLAWNRVATGDPLASLMAGLEFVSGSPEPWYFYIVNMPLLLTLPGSILLLVGLIDKKTIRDKGRLVLLLWLVAFFAFSSIIPHKETRYIIDYAPPLVAFATLGVCRLEARMPAKTKIIAWILVALWLSVTFYPAVNSSLTDARSMEAGYGSYDEFVAVSAWVNSNIDRTSTGATDIPTALSFQTDRSYNSLEYLTNAAQTRGITLDQFMSEVGVKFVVVRTISDYGQIFVQDPNFTLVKQFPTYRIYTFKCLNCAK